MPGCLCFPLLLREKPSSLRECCFHPKINAAILVFVKLWTEREHISAVKSVKPFLLTAVKHACLNALRGNGVKLKYGDVGVMAEECVTRETEDYILYSELNERLQEALKLPCADCRTMIIGATLSNLPFCSTVPPT